MRPAHIETCQEGGIRTTNPMNQTLMISQKYSPDSTTAGCASSNNMACRLLDNGSADVPATMPSTWLYSTLNSTGGLIPLLKIPIAFHLHKIPGGTSTYATTPDYSYSGHKAAATSLTPTTTNRPDVAWKQQPEEGVVLQSVTMPIKNFFLSSSLTPTRSSHYPFLYSTRKRPLSTHATGTSLNCTSLFPP
jgi:hypothetical protein